MTSPRKLKAGRLLGVTIVIFIAFSLMTSCGGGGGGDSSTNNIDTGSSLFPTTEDSIHNVSEIITAVLDGIEINIASKQLFAIFNDSANHGDYIAFEEYLKNKNMEILGQIPNLQLIQIGLQTNDAISSIIDEISNLNYISHVFPNLIANGTNITCPQTENFYAGMPVWFDGNRWQDHINLFKAWGITTGCSEIKIGIIDSYVNLSSEFLTMEKNSEILSLKHTNNGHGTTVAAIAAGKCGIESKICGVSWESPVLSYDVFRTKIADVGSFTEIGTILFAGKVLIDRNTKVINMSIGNNFDDEGVFKGYDSEDKQKAQTMWRSALHPLVKLAYDENVLIVMGIGNDITNNPLREDNTLIDLSLDQNPWKKNTIIVTASYDNRSLDRWYNSAVTENSIGTRGSIVDIAAPTYAMSHIETYLDVDKVYLFYEWEGSSFAAPQVTGAAALIFGLNPDLPVEEVKQILIENGQGSNAIPILDVYAALLDYRIGYDPDDGSNEIIPYPYDNSYYPLAVGLKWKFSDGSTMEIVGTEYINGYLCFVREEKSSDFYSGVNDFYVKRYLHKDGNNVYVIAMVFAFIDGRPDSWLRINNPVYPLHKEPFYVGASWTKGMSVDPFVDRWIDDKWYDVYWDISYEVVSDTETVSIRNGELNDCLELRTTSTDLYINQDDSTDRFFKYSNSYYFRARGIGPVRSIEQNTFTGETSEYNLVSFTFN